jgi:DNA-binding FadR family transcriptional regulator
VSDQDPTNLTTSRRGDQLSLAPIAKEHAADRIVEQLAALIVRGELRAGESLPSERVLGERFGVARGTVRQAIHKLADWGLLQTKQGGITRVGNVDEVYSLELTALRYRLGPVDERERLDWIERRMLQGVSIVALAELNVDPAILDEVDRHVALLETIERPEDVWEIEANVWACLTRMAGNKLFERESRWFFSNAALSRRHEPQTLSTPAVRLAFYRELVRRLREGDGAARFFLEATQLVLRSTQALRGPSSGG